MIRARKRRIPQCRDWQHLEPLEPRLLLDAVEPTDFEQYMVELINPARANPTAEADLLEIDLNEGLASQTITTNPKPPVAINLFLTDAAGPHSQWMIDNDTFDHTGADDTTPKQRMINAGYNFTAPQANAENLALLASATPLTDLTDVVSQLHETLFVDDTTAGRTHRLNLLDDNLREIGVGLASGDYLGFNAVAATQDFARSGNGVFLTGVAYDDSLAAGIGDDLYTPGEGLAAVTVTAVQQVESGDPPQFVATTWNSGGYSLLLGSGTYNVTADGPGLDAPMTFENVVISDQNVKLDFRQDTDADLIVTSFDHTAGDYGFNNSFTVDGLIQNQGTEATAGAAFEIEIRLSTDQVWGNSDDVVVASTTQSQSLGPGQSRAFTATGSIPANTAQDLYYVAVFADDDLAIAESDDHNNILWSSAKDVSVSPPQPMIELVSPAQHIALVSGSALAINWTDSDGDDNAVIDLFHDTDFTATPWASGDGTLISSLTEDPDGQGDQISWDTTGVEPGNYTIWARISDGSTQAFSRAAGIVTLTSPVPQINLSTPQQDTTVVQGDQITIQWTDADSDDNASIALAFDPDLDASPWLNGNHTLINLTPIDEDPDGAADQFVWDTTDVAAGTYSIWARITDGSNETFSRAPGIVTIESPLPSINLIEPAENLTVVQGQTVTVQWSDADADDNAQIQLAYDPDDTAQPWTNDNHAFMTETALSEDPDAASDEFIWNTTAVPAATYTIWAWITDATNNAYSRAVGRVTVEAQQLQIQMTQPDQNLTVTAGQSVALAWTDETFDLENTVIRLAYDIDDNDTPWSNENHTFITATPLDGQADGDSDQFQWDTSAVPTGTYTVWAWLTDTVTNAYSRATGRVTVLEPSAMPGAPDLLAETDDGVADDDNITSFDNSAAPLALSFLVADTVPGATVTILANGIPIGSAVAVSQTTTVTTDAVTSLDDGPKTVTARQIETGKGESNDSASTDVTIDTTPPTVLNLLVNGTSWLDDPNSPAAPVPVSVGSGNQLIPLTWFGIDQVQIVFSENVTVQQADLSLTGQQVAQYQTIAFAYDPQSFTAIWTLDQAIQSDLLTLTLEDNPVDAINLALDGQWDNPVDVDDPLSDTYPSGDGQPGGDFVFNFNVEPISPTVSLDADGNGQASALTDGILIVRYLFGLTGDNLVAGNVLPDDATRTTADEIAAFLDQGVATMLDPDGNGQANALTDGILIVRYLFGLTGNDLTAGNVLPEDATRTEPSDIAGFLAGFMPALPAAAPISSSDNTFGALQLDNADSEEEEDVISRWLVL